MSVQSIALSMFALTLSASSIVDAALIQINYKYTTTSTFGGFPAPKTFEVQSLYDLDDLDVVFTGGNLKQYGFVSGSVLVDGATYIASGGNLSYHDQVPFATPRDRVSASLDLGFDFDGVFLSNVGVTLEGPESIFSFDDIPFIPDPGDFTISTNGVVTFQFEGNHYGSQSALESVSFSAVPIPGAVWLFGSGLIGLIGLTRRKNK